MAKSQPKADLGPCPKCGKELLYEVTTNDGVNVNGMVFVSCVALRDESTNRYLTCSHIEIVIMKEYHAELLCTR